MTRDLVKFVRARFRSAATEERAISEKAYLKSDLQFHGVTAKDVRDAAKAWSEEHRGASREELRAWVDVLFATTYFDLHSTGIALLERNWKTLTPADFPWMLGLVRSSSNWAHVDFLVTKVIGPIIEVHPASLAKSRVWARDPSFWVRRTALLAQLRQLRRGAGDFDLFVEIAVPMLSEKEFFIRKALGWVLREVSKKRPELVRGFLDRHGEQASGLTRREASKYLPAVMDKPVIKKR